MMPDMLIVIVFVSLTLSFAQPSDELSNNDDIALREIVLELKNVLMHQNERIAALEKKCQSVEEKNSDSFEEIIALRKRIKTQDIAIAKLNRNIRVCEKTVAGLTEMFSYAGKQQFSRKTADSAVSSISRKGKRFRRI